MDDACVLANWCNATSPSSLFVQLRPKRLRQCVKCILICAEWSGNKFGLVESKSFRNSGPAGVLNFWCIVLCATYSIKKLQLIKRWTQGCKVASAFLRNLPQWDRNGPIQFIQTYSQIGRAFGWFGQEYYNIQLTLWLESEILFKPIDT